MARMARRLTLTIVKPPELRPTHDIEFVLPWLKLKSEVLGNLEDKVLTEIVRECEHKIYKPNEIVISQGDIGDTLFVILSGSVSVYINTGEQTEEQLLLGDGGGTSRRPSEALTVEERLRRSLGKFIIKFESGKCFGEVAMVNDECMRTASVVTDEVCHFMAVPRDIYDSTLRTFYDKEYAERTAFIDTLPLFREWNDKEKRGLVEALQKHTYSFNTPIMKQGQPWTGMAFIVKGHAKCEVEPGRHGQQYPALMKLLHQPDLLDVENLRPVKKKTPRNTPRDVGENKAEHKEVEHVHVKRKQGYAAAEKRQYNRYVTLCSVAEGDVAGEIEGVVNLTTNAFTVTALSEVTIFLLNPKNFERLITRRGGEDDTYLQLHEAIVDKLSTRLSTAQGAGIPLLQALANKMTTVAPRPFKRQTVELRDSKHLPSEEVLFTHLMNKFVKNEAELLIPKVPGGVYYRDLALEKTKLRNSVEEHNSEETAALRKMRKVKRIKRARRPPSLKPRTVKALKKALVGIREEQQLEEKKAYIQEVRQREEDEIRQARARFNKFKRYSMAKVTHNNQKFEPGKLTQAMLEHHNEVMQSKFKTEEKTVKSNSPTKQITFITKIREQDAQSTPDFSKIEPPKKSILKRPVSAHHTNSAGDEVDQVAAGNAHEHLSRASSRDRSGRSRLLSRELGGGSTADLDIETGVLPLLSENPAYRDWETSDTSLSYLEEKVKEFALKQHPHAGRRAMDLLPPLVRYQQKDETEQQPVPGGHVLVKSKPCSVSNRTRYYMKDHQHTHTSMVRHLADYEDMRKNRMIRHMIQDEERKEWLQEQDKKYKHTKRTSMNSMMA